jgi:hypothetical protein
MMKRLQTLLSNPICAATPWINELHYENSGADLNEFVEVALPVNGMAVQVDPIRPTLKGLKLSG